MNRCDVLKWLHGLSSGLILYVYLGVSGRAMGTHVGVGLLLALGVLFTQIVARGALHLRLNHLLRDDALRNMAPVLRHRGL